ncbi:hypothetical protein ACFSJW_13545 [Flavobacterium artemisiae]|uniref:Uncharacterized protein n=1 Tax=Flavobacterium artemisiae TaxID=2126556 RepID=A0ABW4HG89_9FLAO
MKTLLLFIFCFLAVHCFAQIGEYSQKTALAVETYAYLKGQQSALKKISSEFPGLHDDVLSVQKNIDLYHGRSQRNIELFLKEEFSEQYFLQLTKHLDSMITQQLKNPIEREKYAEDLLDKIHKKIRSGTIGTTDKGILSFAYHDRPHQELTDGHTINYSTKGHPKAEESVVKIPVPKSWTAEEAEHPDTIQQFTSYAGKGDEKILLMIYQLAESERNMLLTKESVYDFIAPQSVLIRSEKVTIDGIPGVMAEIEEVIDFAVNQKKVRMLQFMFIHQQKLYCLQGSVGPAPIHHDLGLQLRKYEPLFRLVAQGTDIMN